MDLHGKVLQQALATPQLEEPASPIKMDLDVQDEEPCEGGQGEPDPTRPEAALCGEVALLRGAPVALLWA